MPRNVARYVSMGLILLICAGGCAAALEIETASYAPDREFPELLQYFKEGWGITNELGQTRQYTEAVKRGAYLHAVVHNASDEPLAVERVLLQGIDLAEQLAPRHAEHRGVRAASFLLNGEDLTPPALRQRLEAAGSPVWWMVRPDPIPANGFAEVVVRLRELPEPEVLSLTVTTAGESITAEVRRRVGPAIVSTALASGMDRLFVCLRGQDFEVTRVSIDGRHVATSAPSDLHSAGGILPLEIPLREAWERGSFHCVTMATHPGRETAAVVRALRPSFALGMWGYRNEGLTLEEMVRDCCETFQEHLFNTHMAMAGAHTGYLDSAEGLGLLAETGLRLMVSAPHEETIGSEQLYARFLLDEPDCSDYRVDDLPWDQRIGASAQGLVERQREWTLQDPLTPSLLNVDMTFKPENWLTYGQLPDIFAVDPYYQNRLRDAYWSHPARVRQFCTPYYVFAVAEIARSGCQPAPLHIILNSTSFHGEDRTFRYGTPEEKRIEFYHSVAAGARGISYWWFTPYGRYVGCGARDPGAYAMMQELARLNAEALAVADLLAIGCPAHAPGSPDPFASARPEWLMTRTLLCGTHAALVVLVNRDHASDREGTVFAPIPRARVHVELPHWLEARHALRLAAGELTELQLERGDGAATCELEDVQLTELLILADRESIVERVRRQWQNLQPRLAAVAGRTYEQWATARQAAEQQRRERLEQRRQELFARYSELAEQGSWVEASQRMGTYGYETERIWNPTETKYNAQTWWVGRGEVTDDIVKGLRWRPPEPGRWRVAVSYRPKHLYRLRVVRGDEVLAEKLLEGRFPDHAEVADRTVEIPEGAALEFVQLGSDTGGEMWGRVSPHAVFVPAQ
ncbi:MAG: hypothetical protein U9R79_20725 [Armatimonadota bacterium]|nr:hypothetical protein [Armatimonadota bacterium]